MMKQKRIHILPALLASLLLLITSGCTQDQAGGIRYGAGNNLHNNGQVNDPLGNKGRRNNMSPNSNYYGQQPGPYNGTPQTSTPPVFKQPEVKVDSKSEKNTVPGYALVTAQPLSPEELCKEVQKNRGRRGANSVWDNYEPLDKDGISDECEALIMKSRYADNDSTPVDIVDPANPSEKLELTSFDLRDEYLAIHPTRLNGFLVGAVVFPEGEKGFKKIRKKIKNPAFAGLFAGKNKEYKDEDKEIAADSENQDRVSAIFHRMKQNLKRNSKLGENEAPQVTLADGSTVKVPYTREFFDLMYSLKNEGESDIQAYRRIFHGAVVDAQGNGDVLIEDILPTKDNLLKNRPVKVPVIASKAWPTLDSTVVNTRHNQFVAVVSGGKSENIPARLNRPMTLGEISGLNAETKSLREAGSFQVTFETNLLLPKGSELAIGFLSKDTESGRRIIGNSRLSGTFTTIIDGQTSLITSSTIMDGSNQNINSKHREFIDRGRFEGCKTSHVIINYVSNDEAFNTENNITPLSESVFYKLPGDEEPWKPLHAGIASVYPVAERKGVTCVPSENRFFNTAALNEGAVATQFHRDHFLHILSPSLSDKKVRIPTYLYGEKDHLPAPSYAEIQSDDEGSASSQISDSEENRMIITVSGCDSINTSKAALEQLRMADGSSLTNENEAVQSYQYDINPSEICINDKDGDFYIKKIEIKSSVMDDHKWEGSKQFTVGR